LLFNLFGKVIENTQYQIVFRTSQKYNSLRIIFVIILTMVYLGNIFSFSLFLLYLYLCHLIDIIHYFIYFIISVSTDWRRTARRLYLCKIFYFVYISFYKVHFWTSTNLFTNPHQKFIVMSYPYIFLIVVRSE